MDGGAFTPPELTQSLIQPLPSVVTAPEKSVKPSKLSKPGLEEDDTLCLVQGVAESIQFGQSYKSIGFDKERAIVNRAFADRSE